MNSKILLINFGYSEQEKISRLGVDVDLGFLSNAWSVSGSHDAKSKPPQTASFYSPLAIYEYKAVIIRLTKNPPLANTYNPKAKIIEERDRTNFFSYWYDGRGVLIVVTDESDFLNLDMLGIPLAHLENSSGNDATVDSYSTEQNQELKKVLKEVKSTITIPPAKYILVPKRESEYNVPKRWTIYTPYTNRNDDSIGIYLNWGSSYENEEQPAFLILPAFRDYNVAIEKLLKALSKIYPRLLPEIADHDWLTDDKFYPKEITNLEKAREKLINETGEKLETLKAQKKELKEKYKYLHQLLTASGDELKDAVIKTLADVFDFEVEDLDESRKNNFREDLLVSDKEIKEKRFVEVKGTKNSNPTLSYVVQLQNNLLKRGDSTAKGALILNYDLTRNPSERADAYSSPEEEEAIKGITYIDTRVLFELALAIVDIGMPKAEARKVLFGSGRIFFSRESH